jgi:hypothetical protein
MYSNKVNGHAFAGEHLTSNIDYFTVSTPVNLTAAVANGISALDKLVEVVSLRGQPVIMGAVTGTGPYVLKFATEHKGSWNVSGDQVTDNSAADLKAAIIAHGVGFGFDANTTVTVSASL